MHPSHASVVCPRCGERLPEGFTRCDACGAWLDSPGAPAEKPGRTEPSRNARRRGASTRGVERRSPASGAPWLYLVVGLAVGGAVGYALHGAVGPRPEGGSPTGPADILAGMGGGADVPPGAPRGQMPADVAARVQAYRQALARDPDDVQANIGFANLLFDSGQWERAAEHYTKALEKDPTNPDVRVDRAIAYHNLGQNDRAQAEMARATREHPGHRNAWLNLGVVSSHMGDRATAIRAWEQYLKLEPSGEHSSAIRAELESLKKGS